MLWTICNCHNHVHFVRRRLISIGSNYENYSTLNSVSSSMENVINSSKKVLNNKDISSLMLVTLRN